MPHDEKPHAIGTRLARSGGQPDPRTGAVAPPINPSSTFARDADYELIGPHLYSRYGDPTNALVETLVAGLDDGEAALTFGSGMAAVSAILDTVPPGAHVVAPQVMYFGAQALMSRHASRGRLALTLYDQRDPTALHSAIRPGHTDLVWIETPANPSWDVIDIAEAARAAHESGAALVMDATCSPPVTTRPLTLGADLVMHSATKYLNGHSDLTAGVVVTRRADARWEAVRHARQSLGSVLGAFEAWLLLRGLRTLEVRFDRASSSAMSLARHFARHPAIEQVLYPGLESHPGHEIARRQMTRGFGGMLSLLLRADAATARRVAANLRCFTPATSLGGVESLVEHRATIEGPDGMAPANLLRLSIGLEDPADLIDDLERTLAALIPA